MVSAATKMDPATEELLKDKGRWVVKKMDMDEESGRQQAMVES